MSYQATRRHAPMETGTPVPQVPAARPGHDVPFRRLLEVVPAGAYTTDVDGLITAFNRPAVELWGREPKVNDPIDRY